MNEVASTTSPGTTRCQQSADRRHEPIRGMQRRPTAPGHDTEQLTLCQAAEVLHLGQKAVLGYVRRGELIGRRVGRRWWLRRADIDAFLEPPPHWDLEFSREE